MENELFKKLEIVRQEYLSDAINHSKSMSFRHGDCHEEPEFEPEQNSEFYLMIIKNLLDIIDKKVVILKQGAFIQGSEIQIVNPLLGEPHENEWNVNGKFVLLNDEWAISYKDTVYELSKIKFV